MAGSARTFDPNVHDLHEIARAFKMQRLQVPLSTFDQTGPPVVAHTLGLDPSNPLHDDDITKGWKIGSLWIDTTNGNIYQCADNAENAAVWRKMVDLDYVGPSGGQTAGSGTPTNLEDEMILRADGIDGKIQGSVVKITDAGVISGATGIGTLISDDVYGAGWNGVTTIAPSKNAVYDKIETLVKGESTFTFFSSAVPVAII